MTQPTSGGAVTADTNCCANCLETSRPQQWTPDSLFFCGSRLCGLAGLLALLLIKAGDVETNQVRQHHTYESGFAISAINKYILGSRYPCATGLNTECTSEAQVSAKHNTHTWTCHLHRESRLTSQTDITPPIQTLVQAPYPLPTYTTAIQTRPIFPLFSQDW